MSDIIQLLPDAIANQIAAGEVIQRPSSVVKELLENAVDAQSTSVKLLIKDAGKLLIQVIDNGCGMSMTDARMCFERHATSKIKAIQDLFELHTMGFRGEALASIAAIAQVEMKTRLHNEEVGTIIKIEGSKIINQEPCNHPPGSSIAVKNLFYNVPARRNFLKSNPVETKHIIDEFLRVALANPAIQFSLYQNDEETFHLPSGNLRQRIVSAFGTNFNERLVPVSEETDYIKISGFIGRPEHAKRTRGEQYFFLNNRFIKSPYLNHAVMSAYDNLLLDKTYPFYVLKMEMDPSTIDINVHPTKQEVKFEDERSVYMIMSAAVKHGLAQYSITPSIDFEQEAGLQNIKENNHTTANQVSKGFYGDASDISFEKQKHEGWKQLYEFDKKSEDQIITIQSKWEEESKDDLLFADATNETQKTLPFQIHHKYIISQIKSGFIIIDQYHAHKRILYERYLGALEGKALPSQKLLFPKTLQLNLADFTLICELLPSLNILGFEIEQFGNNSIVIHGLPADLSNQNEETIIENLLEQRKNSAPTALISERNKIASMIARMSAIQSGKVLDVTSMQRLIDELFACTLPSTTPEGQPTFITYKLEDLENHFKR